MKRISVLITMIALAIALAGCGAPADAKGLCTIAEQRTASVSAAGANGVNVKGQVGSVKVIGRPGLKDVQVSGTACGTSESALTRIKLTTGISSDGWVRVLADVPRGSGKLDITVEVPEDLTVMARNEAGTLDVSQVRRGANVRGDAGTVTVTDVVGGLTLDSRDGLVTISRVEGNVNVTRADNGALGITDVKGNVTLTKRNGAVAVVNVDGNLTVTGKVNGLVTYREIEGKVSVPN